ncbi:hypothetical protein JSY14_11015 [Brachybacterium sp. EF45031]|uniref:hypothetical protein n=1 Tax=Brachybacterium sillae TaxID=2810536 RepID=UPI00217CE454|nr:hypothetical protein [Brachybacterium sillae]MCS6712519.1 hypothetical protein [Brachybacterium sillae]
MTTPAPETTAACCSSGDPHDHSGHDHPRTGAEVVRGLVRALSVVALVLPALVLVTMMAALAATPSSPAVLFIGIALGALQIAALGLSAALLTRAPGVRPDGLRVLVTRSVVDEVLRLAAVLLALVLWPTDARGPLGLWVGVGAATVWGILATIQTVLTRKRLARPSAWGEETVMAMLADRTGVARVAAMRVVDVVAVICFQLGASVLVATAPVMTVATIVLSLGSGLATLILHRHAPAERPASPWAWAPAAIGLLLLVLALTLPAAGAGAL